MINAEKASDAGMLEITIAQMKNVEKNRNKEIIDTRRMTWEDILSATESIFQKTEGG